MTRPMHSQNRPHVAARFSALLLFCVLLLQCAPAKSAPQTYGTLLSFDFDTHSWAGAKTASIGTIDTAGSKQASRGLQGARAIASGPLAISSRETNLGKLTLAFSLSANAAKPITVRVTSFNAKKKRTGSLQTVVYPAAPDFYQRYAVDVSACKPSGTGKFVPNAPFVSFSFSAEGSAWQGVAGPELRVDNVNYALPAYYVSPTGSDSSDGRTEKTAFLTPQKALDAAQAGDIVVLMNGTYDGGDRVVASFPRAGTPAAWIVLKNYPGQHPLLTCHAWNMVFIGKGSKQEPYDGPTLAYLEVRGLHLRGEGDVAKKKYPEAMNQADPRTNTNGISIDGRAMKNTPHHIRIASNIVEYCPGGGIGPNEADWVTMEDNVSRCNCWTTIYGSSGMGTLGASNFDAAEGIYKMLIRNNVCYRNQTYEIWKEVKHASDGNGIIIDVNQHTGPRPDGAYIGRTLVQNNLCFDNGGSGIHTVRAFHVDIIGNTTYLNSANKDLQYSEIFTYGSDDVRIMNNILVAPVANVAAGEKPEPVNRLGGKNTRVVFQNNLYFGGNIAPDLGEGDKIGDPLFVSATVDPKAADFHLKAGSPAVGAGLSPPFAPFLDLDGRPRGAKPNLGAF